MCVIQVSDRMVTSPNLQGGSYFGFSAIMTSSLFIVDTVVFYLKIISKPSQPFEHRDLIVMLKKPV